MTSPTYGDVTQLDNAELEVALEHVRNRLAYPKGFGRQAMCNLDVACDDWAVLLTERKRREDGGKPFTPTRA